MAEDNTGADAGAVKAKADAAAAEAVAAAAAAAEADGKKKVSFDVDQQGFVNGLVNDAYGRAWDKAGKDREKAITDAVAAATADLQKKYDDLAKATTPPADDKDKKKAKEEDEATKALRAQYDELVTNQTALLAANKKADEELKTSRESTRKTSVKEAFITAAKDIAFFDPMEVMSLIEHKLDVDEDGSVVIMNPRTKQPLMGMDMKPIPLADFLAQFAKEKAYLVRASNDQGGTGAAGSKKVDTEVKDGKLPDFSKMTLADVEAYKQELQFSR